MSGALLALLLTATPSEMAYYHTPGVSIAVINDDRIEWARAFGVREQGKPAPVTEETLFQAGSVSKPIFAMAVMRLVQEKALDLDEDVNRYLTSWKIPASQSWQPRVTLRQILTHSAGLTVHGFPGYATNEKLPTVIDILEGRPNANTPRVEVNILPGMQLRYSGGGTTVAQQAVVDRLGQPFPRIMRETLLDPLGMVDSTYEQPLPVSRTRVAASAHPWKGRPLPGRWHVYPEMAAAGLWTTPTDLARAGVELQKALKGESALFTLETAKRMLTLSVTEEIGIGFFLEGKGEDVRFGHGGWDEGFVAEMTVYKWVEVPLTGAPPLRAWVVYPERKDKAAVVLVIHEVYGLTDWIRGVADRLAADGFIAVAPDFLSGRGPGGGATESFASRDDVTRAIRTLTPEEVNARLDSARAYATRLPAANGRSAVIGFCWGGARSFAYAAAQPDLDAAVVYYGPNPSEPSVLAKVKAPILGQYGGDDDRVNATIEPASTEMKKLGKTYEYTVHEGAGHGFLRAQEGREGANLRASLAAWARTIAFLREHTDS